MRGRNSAGVEFHALLRAHQISSMNRFSRQDIVRRREPGMCGPACLDTRYEFGAEAGGIILHDVSAASAAIPAPRMAQNGHLVGASQDADIAKRIRQRQSRPLRKKPIEKRHRAAETAPDAVAPISGKIRVNRKLLLQPTRSEESRVGTGCVSTCR